MRTAGWWQHWLWCRDVEEYRSWHGRDGRKRLYVSTDQHSDQYDAEAGESYGDYLLPATTFEDRVLDLLDFGAAWPKLSPYQQLVFRLTAAGMSDIEIGKALQKSQNAIAQQKKMGRAILREACAVRY